MELTGRFTRLLTPRMILRRGADGLAYLTRWGIRTRLFSIYVHRFDGPDPGIDLHDHPWTFRSIVLRGGYVEERCRTLWAIQHARVHQRSIARMGFSILGRGTPVARRRFHVNHMPLDTAHKITDVIPGTITLVLCGPVRRSWGFYTPFGYVRHDLYEHPDHSLTVELRDDVRTADEQ